MMKFKIYLPVLLIIILPLLPKSAEGQQLSDYNHYFINPYLYNPATAGNNGLSAYAIHKAQWTGIPGAPLINTFTMDGPLMNNKAGFGFLVSDDKRGITKRTSISGSFSYKIKFSEDSYLNFGAMGAYVNKRLLFNQVIINNPDDPMMTDINAQREVFDATVGFMFIHNNLQAGLAIPKALASNATLTENNVEFFYQNKRHYLISAAYNILLIPEKEITLTPLCIVRMIPGAPVQYDVNVTGDWKQVGWLAASYKNNYSAGISGGVHVTGKLSLGYSYDINIFSSNSYLGTSHEFLLGYSFNGENKKFPFRKIKPGKQDQKYLIDEIEEYKRRLKEQEKYVDDLIDKFYSEGPSNEIKTEEDIDKIYNKQEMLKNKTEEKIQKKEKKLNKRKKNRGL